MLLVYRPGAMPEPHATIARWRHAARKAGLPDLHVVAALTFGLTDPRPIGFDVERQAALAPRPFRVYRTAMAGWDNTARLGGRGTVFHGATPQSYEAWLRSLVTTARLGHTDHRLVFVNAWNE